MKKIVLIVAAALAMVACNSTKTYVVEGQISGLEGEVAIMDLSGEELMASATVTDGSFTMNVKSEGPAFTVLSINGQMMTPVFLDGSPIKIVGDMANPQTIVSGGTAANDGFAEFNAMQWELMGPVMSGEVTDDKVMEVFMEIEQRTAESYEKNADNLWGAYLFVSNKYREMETEEILATIEAYPADIQKMNEVALLKEYAEGRLKTGIGQRYIDITMPNVEGVEVPLSEVIAMNKYVLLDFWASWCRPCMSELPYLHDAYKAYHPMGFEIYGVSLDEEEAAWKSTVEQQNMSWVNVSTLQGWNTPAAKAYSVDSIPANLLIDAEGRIVAKNLRGEALVEKLYELMGN